MIRVETQKMKNGRIVFFIASCFVIGAALAQINKKPIKTKIAATKDQYKNRLKEFYLDDVDEAQKEFDEFVDLGLSNSDAFDLTIVKKFYF